MSSALFFAVGTIGLSTRGGRKPSTLLGAARHNQRAIQAERGGRRHIDPARSNLNETIAGPATPEAVVALALALMTVAGVKVDKLRKDHAQAVELLFSLPPDTTIDTGEYFHQCLAWAGERFGESNILSACIHRDEAAPHCHILILPLVDGRMCGSSLLKTKALKELRKSFSKEVARGFGLKEPEVRMSGAEHGIAVRMVLEKLESNQDALLQSCLWQTVRRDIERNPARYMAALGLELPVEKREPKKPQRTMAQIFTSPGKGTKHEKPTGFGISSKASAKKSVSRVRLKPIGFECEANNQGQKNQYRCSVGFGQNSEVFTATEPSSARTPFVPTAAHARPVNNLSGPVEEGVINTTRERDGDHEAGQWCEELGEFIQAPAPPSRAARDAAHDWTRLGIRYAAG